MFTAQTPMRLHGCNGKTAKDSDGNRKRVVLLTWMLQPFTPEMAADLNVKSHLFRADGSPKPEIQSAALNIKVPLQHMALSSAPDVAPSVEVDAVDVSTTLKVSADREGPIYTAYFSCEFDYPQADHLLWLFHQVTEQLFATFTPAQGDMLAREGSTSTKLRKSKKDQPALEEEDGNGDDQPPATH